MSKTRAYAVQRATAIVLLTVLVFATGGARADEELPALYENQVITANPPAPRDYLGYYVAIDGATAAIAKSEGQSTPAILLYRYTGSGWQHLKTIGQPEGTLNSTSPKVALDGNTLLFGVPGHDGTEECTPDGACGNSGIVYVFERNAGGMDNWGLVATLDGGHVPGALFGSDLALDGGIAAVAASSEDGQWARSGALYLFEKQPGVDGQWVPIQRLEYDGAFQDALFGAGVQLKDGTMVTGVQPTIAGTKVLIYEREANHGGLWTLAQEIDFPLRRLYEVRFDGQTLLWIDLDEQDGSWAGTATYRYFERNASGTWAPVQTWEEHLAWAQTPKAFLKDGRMIERAQDGTSLARLHARDPGTGQWGPVANLRPANHPFPDQTASLAIDGQLALIGSWLDSNDKQGEALAYDLGMPINFGHAGAWFDQATSGQGILVDVDSADQYMFLSWFTYTDAAAAPPGEQHWFTAQGEYSGSTAALTLHESVGGSFMQPGGVGTVPVGELVLSFGDCLHAAARYRIDTLGLWGEIPLQRLIADSQNVCEILAGPARHTVAMNGGMDGAWYDDAMPGQGFLLDAHRDDTSGYVFVSWFTYGAQTVSGQRWLTAQGSFEGASAVLDLHETTGGLFDDPKKPQTVPIGTLTLDFADCDNARVDYDLPGETLSGSVSVIRLLPGSGEYCESAQ